MKTHGYLWFSCVVLNSLIFNLSLLAGTVTDFRTDFVGQTNNPHADSSGLGNWSYYRSDTVNPSDAGANLAAYVWDEAHSQFKDLSTDYGQVRQTNVHPVYGNFTIVRWQAASNDTYLGRANAGEIES